MIHHRGITGMKNDKIAMYMKMKTSHMEADLNQPLTTALRPEEAGTVVEKLLSEDESLLLYWFQNSRLESRTAILMKARSEYYITQREINEKLTPELARVKAQETYGQMELPL